MKDNSSQIRESLDDFKQGNVENALCDLTSLPHEALTELISTFRKETDKHVRVFLVEAIWQHRQLSVIPFLAEVLHDPEPDVWKESLDGLVTLASPQAIDALRSARTRQFPRDRDAVEYRGWIDEAIEQAEAVIQRNKV